MLARGRDDICIQIQTSLDVFGVDFAYLYVVLRNSDDPVKDHILGKIAFNRTLFLERNRRDLIRQYLLNILMPYCRIMFNLSFYTEEISRMLSILETKFNKPIDQKVEEAGIEDLASLAVKLIKIGKHCYQLFNEKPY